MCACVRYFGSHGGKFGRYFDCSWACVGDGLVVVGYKVRVACSFI